MKKRLPRKQKKRSVTKATPKQRSFDGKVFRLQIRYHNKSNANTYAKKQRGIGKKIRIVPCKMPGGTKGYAVYGRRSK